MLERAPALPRPGTTPNWFASVMGSGIVATGLPRPLAVLRPVATVVWALAAMWLVVLLWQVVADRRGQRRHFRDPVMIHFWGAPPMALLTIGAGSVALGRDWFGGGALVAGGVLWVAGTVLGLVTAVAVPYRMIVGRVPAAEAFGGWLMPVVPPMVSAATGAALVPHLPAGQPRLALLLACYAMFGVSLFATLALLPQIWQRLVTSGTEAGRVPTLWIVLGPLGQSVTAANLLGAVAPGVLPFGPAAAAFGLFYGVATWGFAMLWLAIAAAVTLRTVRAGMPFSLTWWSFTFPVGTCVTGSSALAAVTGSALFDCAAVSLYVLLIGAWVVVVLRTAQAGGRR
ncbi:TDT family transporter [Amycolatopsis thermophila]|uniref:C4-dicarboxylate transporter/malic acid transport protein n=1 Tax=Amycolatopsis thermophila TaxID=206084 RepID=A0ABU0EQ87_9PSEU|nr:TDT family transporter [Amycolatopsis thermophila]MDQ0377417.1 C4-dicarboxylate transporter/malic acid transport protein [Amycolatopsis thermophila]